MNRIEISEHLNRTINESLSNRVIYECKQMHKHAKSSSQSAPILEIPQ